MMLKIHLIAFVMALFYGKTWIALFWLSFLLVWIAQVVILGILVESYPFKILNYCIDIIMAGAWLLYRPHSPLTVLFLLFNTLNAVVMAANNGRMPVVVHRWSIRGCINQGDTKDHFIANQTTRFRILSDWIPVPKIGMASPGDVLGWVGFLGTITNFF